MGKSQRSIAVSLVGTSPPPLAPQLPFPPPRIARCGEEKQEGVGLPTVAALGVSYCRCLFHSSLFRRVAALLVGRLIAAVIAPAIAPWGGGDHSSEHKAESVGRPSTSGAPPSECNTDLGLQDSPPGRCCVALVAVDTRRHSTDPSSRGFLLHPLSASPSEYEC